MSVNCFLDTNINFLLPKVNSDYTRQTQVKNKGGQLLLMWTAKSIAEILNIRDISY